MRRLCSSRTSPMRASFSSVTTSLESLVSISESRVSFVSLKASKARAKWAKARGASAAESADLVSGAMVMWFQSSAWFVKDSRALFRRGVRDETNRGAGDIVLAQDRVKSRDGCAAGALRRGKHETVRLSRRRGCGRGPSHRFLRIHGAAQR